MSKPIYISQMRKYASDQLRIEEAIRLAARGSRMVILDEHRTYNLYRSLDVSQLLLFVGLNRRATVLNMTATNTPIVRTISTGGGWERHSGEFGNMTWQFATQATNAHTRSVCFEMAAGDTGGLQDGNGFYWNHIHDLRLHNGYAGIANYSTGSGYHACWGNQFERIDITSPRKYGASLSNAGVIGQPRNVWRDMSVLCSSDGQAADAVAFRGTAIGSNTFQNWGVEDFDGGSLFRIDGGGWVTIDGLCTERCTWAAPNKIFELADGHFDLRNIDCEPNNGSQGDALKIVEVYGADATVTYNNVIGPAGWTVMSLESGAVAVPPNT